MSTFPTNAALEAAIIAHADEDTPRLAYADWLDEHGDPDRAAIIRVQCRLAVVTPNDSDWPDLRDQQDELLARLRHRRLTTWDKTPKRFYLSTVASESFAENFRRGFPYSIDCQTSDAEWTPAETRRVIDDLTQLVRTSTVRGFNPYAMPLDSLRELLKAPVAAKLTALDVYPSGPPIPRRTATIEFARLLADSPALRGLRELSLTNGADGAPGSTALRLAKATAFDSLRRLTFSNIEGPKEDIEELTGAAWFQRLRQFCGRMDRDQDVYDPLATALGRLTELHTLDLPWFPEPGVPALAAGEFPSLATLAYGGPLDVDSAARLAGAKFPSLAVFKGCGRDYGGHGGATDGSLSALLRAGWFARLRVLNLSGNTIGDKGLKALAAHPVAKAIRWLGLGDNGFGMAAFAALAKRGAFPALTTLDLHSHTKRKSTSADLAAFLSALQMPNLRYLDLENWPLGNAGAKAVAANPAFANLTHLHLSRCYIGDPGAKALFASPHLRNLVQLHLGGNLIKSGADALADPTVMPRLGQCWINHNKIPETTAKKFKRDGLDLAV